MNASQGTIFNIQKYSLHDGPGIRTTVFLKGCPLSCLWCHNPESQDPGPELVFWESRCLGCNACVAACSASRESGPKGLGKVPAPAPGQTPTRIVCGRAKCEACGRCVSACAAGAREIAGKATTARAVMAEVLRDRIFYDQSGGGVTFSGGEPLIQPAFLRELLEMCRDEGLSTTVDTSGFAPWASIEPIIPLVDVFLYDVKVMDDRKHREYAGVSNRVVLENLKSLADARREAADGAPRFDILARIPLIPGVNDDDANIRCTGEFLRECGIQRVSVLPYHSLGADKYRRLGREYSLAGMAPPTDEQVRRVVGVLGGFGLTVSVGG